jgi:hypothetical protein
MPGSISRFHSARGARARAWTLAVLGSTGAAVAAPAEDLAEVAGATLSVTRNPGAESCPDARALSDRLAPLLGPDSRNAPLAVDVAFEHAGSEWVADVVVRGSAEGMRRLRAPGPGCGELARRLTALLVIVLDRPAAAAEPAPRPESRAPAVAPVPKPAAPAPAPQPLPARESPAVVVRAGPVEDSGTESRQAEPDPPSISGFVNGGMGLTAGVAGRPLAWIFARFGVERDAWQVSLTGFTSFESTEPLAPGAVDVRWTGGLVRPCVRALEVGPVRALGCGALMVAALSGEAHGYAIVDGSAYRPYYAAGAGVIGVARVGSRLRLSLEASLLAPLVRESFSIRGAGVAFETPRAGGWFGASMGMQIW